MVRRLDPNDFRTQRKVLEPQDFALGSDEPDLSPTDLISEEAWDSIMTLPSDVAVRTTSHQGDKIRFLNELWSDWIEAFPTEGILSEAALDVSDDFAASLFNLVHGFYKQSIASLRNALETMFIACDCELSGEFDRWTAWQRGEEPNFKKTRERLAMLPQIDALELRVRKATGAGMFVDPKNPQSRAWARNLYSRLSNFSHACYSSTNGELWESNGPIYSAEGLKTAYRIYLETYALLVILARVAQAQFEMPSAARVLFEKESVSTYIDEPFSEVCITYSSIV